MCGIAGVAGANIEPGRLKAMARAMVRRGPDDEGFYHTQDVAFAFRRLAIVDLAGGHQPMSNEDGRVWIVFNGEIYDHHLLRAELEQRGHRFATDRSDTEVLVHGWEEWGYDLFPRLNGMFALAIWDDASKRLILARDRYGIKPLYYAFPSHGGVVFGSEIKAIFESGLVRQAPSSRGVMEYFAFQNLWSQQTMFAGIYQLEPATVLTWNQNSISRRKYWDVTFPRSRKASLARLAEEHRDILKRAIRRQLAADVPVKTYLSGGIDSTAISVVAKQFDANMTAYSCIFNLEGVAEDRIVDEREYSRLVAKANQLHRVELEVSPTSLRDCLQDYVRVLEDLRMGPGYVVYLIAQRVAQDAKVVLSGTGGDEFHAGYLGRFQALGLCSPPLPWWRQASSRLKGLLGKKRIAPENNVYGKYQQLLNCFFREPDWHEIFTPEFVKEVDGFNVTDSVQGLVQDCPSSDWRDRVLYVDAKTYLAGLLAFEDKVSMAHSLETRVPLLDNELVDFVLDVPIELLCQGDTGKILFREAVRPWVPPAIYQKPKMGFGPPDSSWYKGQLRSWIEEVLGAHIRDDRGIFRPEYVRQVLQSHFAGHKNNYHLIWSLLNFEIWCQAFGCYGASSMQQSSAA